MHCPHGKSNQKQECRDWTSCLRERGGDGYLRGMRWSAWWQDLRELPAFLRMARALRRAAPGGRDTLGYLLREQAERIPDRIFLRFETEAMTFGSYNAGVNAFAA